MVQILLIGLGAGLAAALLFASVASGAVISMLLFYLAPLPIMIAALGWSHWAGLVAALVAAAGLGAVFKAIFFLAFLFGVGLPAWWLGYLALLARPSPAAPDGFEWYPAGRLVFWAAILGAGVVVLAIPHFGADAETFRAALKSGFERVFRLQTGTPAGQPLQIPGLADPSALFEFFAIAIPPMAAVLTTLTLLINLWLAARTVKLSGRLARPWPDLAAITFPPAAPAVLAGCIAATFLPGMLGIVAGLFAATLLVAYAALGLAVVHATTRAVHGRALVLAGIYTAIAVFGWPLLAVTLIGVAETLFQLRRRVAAKGGPPAAPRT
jgi:hypothetical protein